MDQKIEIFIVEPGKTPRIVSMENTMEAAEELLGGTAQVGCFLRQRVLLISRQCQDGMKPNRRMPDGKGCVRGTFLLCGIPEEGCMFDSLTPAQQKEFQAVFEKPGEFMVIGNSIYADPDDAVDAFYNLWDTMKDGESVMLTKWGGQGRGKDMGYAG